MAKGKPKLDLKKFLLAKGEYLAIGVAGFFMVLLLLWGITKWSSAKPPTDTVKALTNSANQVQSGIKNGTPSEEDLKAAAVPEWAMAKYRFETVPSAAFPTTGPLFDPTAKPDTKKENPNVHPIGLYQVDMIRGAIKAYDIVDSDKGELIGVIINKSIAEQDKGKAMSVIQNFKKGRLKQARPQPKQPPTTPMGLQPPGGQPGPGPGFGGFPGRGGGGRLGGEMGPGGYGFDTGAQRIEKAIEYIPLDQVDKAMEKQKVPAMTVVPLRMVTIHAEVPLKRQLEEIRRALRLQDVAEAQKWGPIYDGYDIQRKVSQVMPNGEKVVITDWADYDFEDKYRSLIASRKFSDNFEDEYWGYFLRYEQALALPLPSLVEETGKYPEIKLENITKTIQKLRDAAKPTMDPSALRKRLNRGTTRGDLYRPLGANDTGASQLYGGEAGGQRFDGGEMPGPVGSSGGPSPLGPPGSGAGRGPRGMNVGDYNTNLTTPIEIEHLLMRFVDVDVQPGYTYEYRIRLRMLNPNYKLPKEVSKPIDADVETLFSPWRQLADEITIPAESFLYAGDWGAYTRKIKEDYEKEKALQDRLLAKDYQAIVESCTWLQEVRTGEGGKREPVGGWVVADFPVARGEYIGRKTYVKLPLWSSENRSYVLREVPDKIITQGTRKDVPQPRGWLLDFTADRSVLVDFEGGKVRTRANNRDVTEEVASELLVLRPDGQLVVKSSVADEKNTIRTDIVSVWDKWVKAVAARKASADGSSEFTPRPGGPGGPGGGDR